MRAGIYAGLSRVGCEAGKESGHAHGDVLQVTVTRTLPFGAMAEVD